ncbi:MAG: hypothetical protein ABI205_09350 [Gemmatimonadaceae bacterium]
MKFSPRTTSLRSYAVRTWVGIAACVVLAGCWHRNNNSYPYVRPDPILIHVESENFLDANVSIIVGGVTRRLGTVIGNNKADFEFQWTNAIASGVVMMATTIGGQGNAQSLNLSVSPGQVIDFRITSVLRQTYATVHDP